MRSSSLTSGIAAKPCRNEMRLYPVGTCFVINVKVLSDEIVWTSEQISHLRKYVKAMR